MFSNLYLAYKSCIDVSRHIEIDNANILGFDKELIQECNNIMDNINKDVVIVARKIVVIDNNSVEQCLNFVDNSLTGCIPMDKYSARRLAKVNSIISIVLTITSLRTIDKSQINLMTQSAKPKYIEIHLHPFISNIFNNNTDIEKAFYHIGNIIEHAIKRDIGVIPSAASPIIKEVLLVPHIDITLYSMGFSKRERRLMLELYPIEFLQNWLKR